jgi:hypothetical protein
VRKFNCLRLEGSMGQFEAEDRGYISDEHFSGWLTIFVVDGLTYEVRTAEGDRRGFGRHRDALDDTLLDGGAERWGVECAFMRERGFDLDTAVEIAPATLAAAQPVAQQSPRPPETVALYDPMLETYWTLRQALAWVTRRDANDVREFAVVSGDRWPRKIGVKRGMSIATQARAAWIRPPMSGEELAKLGVEPGDEERCVIVESNLVSVRQALNQAFTVLTQAIENVALVVNGFVTAESKRRDLTPMECLDLHFEWRLELACFATARVATPYIEPAIRDLRVRRVDVLRIFPENVAVESDEASTGAAGRLRRVRFPELKQFLARSADGAKTKPQLKTEAEANFQGKIFTTRAFEEAFAALSAHQRRQPGETDKARSRRAKSEG